MYRLDHAENLCLKTASKLLHFEHEWNFVNCGPLRDTQTESLGLWLAACDVTELKDLVPCKVITHYHLKLYPFRCRLSLIIT